MSVLKTPFPNLWDFAGAQLGVGPRRPGRHLAMSLGACYPADLLTYPSRPIDPPFAMLALSAARRLAQPSRSIARALSTSARLAAAGPTGEPTSPNHAANLATGSPQTAVSSTAPSGAAVEQATNMPKTCVLLTTLRPQPSELASGC